MKTILLSFVLLFACITRCDAQYYDRWQDGHEIATDYNTCLQGVKDSTGKWFIEPQYERMQAYHSRYIVQAGGKYGLIKHDGTVAIPLVYDYLLPCDQWSSSALRDYYEVTINDKTGIADSANKIIVPVKYLRVTSYYDSTFVAKKGKRSYDFYNTKGTCFPCPWKSKVPPAHEGPKVFLMHRTLFAGKHGMLNDSGKIILPRKYDDIDSYEKTGIMRIAKNGKYGFCSMAGKNIWPLVFTRGTWRDGEDYSFTVGTTGIGPVKLNGKYGLISAKGDTVLPFAYDHISPFGLYDTPELWQVITDSLAGVYSTEAGWLLQPTCTGINNITSYRNQQDSSAVVLLIAEMNGKWGAMTTSGQIVIPFECEDMLWRHNGQHIFLKGDSVLALSVTTVDNVTSLSQIIDPSTERWILWYEDSGTPANTVVPVNNSFSVFHGKDGVRTFYHPGFTKDSVYAGRTMISASTGNYYGMKVPDSILIASCFSVIPILQPFEDFELFDFYSVPEISDTDSSFRSRDFCLLRKKNGGAELVALSNYSAPYYITHRYDVLRGDGTILISGDTVAQTNLHHHRHDGSIYFTAEYADGRYFAVDTNGKMAHPTVRRKIEEFNGNYTWYYTYDDKRDNSCYEIVDNRTGLSMLAPKDYSDDIYPVWDSITLINSRTFGMRILNLNQRKYSSVTGYSEIIPLRSDGTLFAVKTCSHNIGLVDASGKMILDTIYTTITCVDQLRQVHGNSSFRAEFFGTFYTGIVFYNDTQSVLLDPVNKKLIAHADAVPWIWKSTACTTFREPDEDNPGDTLYRFFSNDALMSICVTPGDSARMLPWQMTCVVDSVFSPKRGVGWRSRWYYHRCYYCHDRGAVLMGGNWTRYEPNNIRHVISYRSDSVICFSRVRYNSLTSKYMFSTVMMFNDGPHQMTLDSFFNPASDWRNFIINTLISYVNNHQYITGDCHNPAGIPSMLNETFELSSDGIVLYPAGFEERGVPLVLPVPWKDLDPYLRNDLRSRLPIH